MMRKRELAAVEQEIAARLKEAEEEGAKGNVEASMRIMDRLTELQVRKTQLAEERTAKVEEARTMFFQKLRPCETCGALLSEKDGANRLNEHFLGRVHLGFEAIRNHLALLQTYVAETASLLPRYFRRSETTQRRTPLRLTKRYERERRYYDYNGAGGRRPRNNHDEQEEELIGSRRVKYDFNDNKLLRAKYDDSNETDRVRPKYSDLNDIDRVRASSSDINRYRSRYDEDSRSRGKYKRQNGVVSRKRSRSPRKTLPRASDSSGEAEEGEIDHRR